ncbi:hypothetical protein GQ457_14G024360 [Hibiscus cannabinus]
MGNTEAKYAIIPKKESPERNRKRGNSGKAIGKDSLTRPSQLAPSQTHSFDLCTRYLRHCISSKTIPIRRRFPPPISVFFFLFCGLSIVKLIPLFC